MIEGYTCRGTVVAIVEQLTTRVRSRTGEAVMQMVARGKEGLNAKVHLWLDCQGLLCPKDGKVAGTSDNVSPL